MSSRMNVTRPAQTGAFRRYMLLGLMTLLGYLLQVSFMPHIKIFGVTPNLLYAIIGIVTVAYGKLRAFWVGLTYGLLMQIMCPSVSYLNLALYSLTTLFCSFPFADKPLKTIEYQRATRGANDRRRKDLPAWLRTLLCSMLNITVYEIIQVTYIYLGGNPLTAGHIFRALADVVLTTLLTFMLMFPLRRAILGKRPAGAGLTIGRVIFSQK